MSRIHRDHDARWLRRSVLGLAALNAALLAWALWSGGTVVRDGTGSVTNGWIVAAGIVATFVVAGIIGIARIPVALRRQGQALALFSQALHAGGHLTRLYYTIWFYDDILHVGLVALIALLLYSVAMHLAPPRRPTTFIAFLATLVLAIAAAGAWEIFEFVMDVVLETREQDDLRDTMLDMLDGAVGGAVAGLWTARAAWRERKARELGDAYSDELLD